MARFGARPRSRRDLLRIPQFGLLFQEELPGLPFFCLVVPFGRPVEVVRVGVNTAHGLLGYKHGAYHAEHPPYVPRFCADGLDCGYVDTGDEDDGRDWGDDADGERNGSPWVDGVT